MGQHKVVLDAMHTALDQTGAGSGGSRNIGGTSHYHVALEYELSKMAMLVSVIVLKLGEKFGQEIIRRLLCQMLY